MKKTKFKFDEEKINHIPQTKTGRCSGDASKYQGWKGWSVCFRRLNAAK